MPKNEKQTSVIRELRPTPTPSGLQEALSLHQRGALADAERIYQEILRQQPNCFEAVHLLGVIAIQKCEPERGADLIKRAITLNENNAAAYCNLGKALLDLKRPEEAVANFTKAIELDADFASAYSNRAKAFLDLKRWEEALVNCDRAITLVPNFAEAHNNRAMALANLMRHAEAVASCDRAIALRPDFAEAYNNRAVSLNELQRHEDALASCNKAVDLKPSLVEAHNIRGLTLNLLKRHEDAAAAYIEVIKIDPGHPFTKGMILHQKMLSCSWQGLDKLIAAIQRDVYSNSFSATPFGWQAVATSQRSLQLCAEMYTAQNYPAERVVAEPSRYLRRDIIRVGYLSGELRDHATSHLLVGTLEQHDNSKFQVYCFDNGWDDHSEIRKRINAAAYKIENISILSDAAAATTIRKNEIDILVNLNGYFGKHRMSLFAKRPAPIQVNYLGFPGTLGASYINYIIADKVVIPRIQKEFFAENIAYLPNCYQANDSKRVISDRIFTRVEVGLPETGFVFCCFNNSYKITPEVFDCWMRILKQVEDSVLWLFENNAAAAANLRKEAAARGINAERLVFAKLMPLPEHLARHRLADLFLDTLPYNAHTTASDALWAGLPVLTQIGETFAGRVAASLLTALDLPELIVSASPAYEALAIELASKPEKLAAINAKLANNRLTKPLFDTKLFTKNIEKAYTEMYERHHAGLPPEDIYVT